MEEGESVAVHCDNRLGQRGLLGGNKDTRRLTTVEMLGLLGVDMHCWDEHQRAGSWAGHRAPAYKLKGDLHPSGCLGGSGRAPPASQAAPAFSR